MLANLMPFQSIHRSGQVLRVGAQSLQGAAPLDQLKLQLAQLSCVIRPLVLKVPFPVPANCLREKLPHSSSVGYEMNSERERMIFLAVKDAEELLSDTMGDQP